MTTDGYGDITWWGFSPATDLYEMISTHTNNIEAEKEINILLVGNSDARHVIKTLAGYTEKNQKLNIYIEENSLELVARQMLFLQIALESNDVMGGREKAELYLEILGNTLLRSESTDYIVSKSNKFIELVTDLNKMTVEFPLCNISNLKFKERDQLEGIFKFWRNPQKEAFDIKQLWDNRLRHFLGMRYDYRDNAYDWEYSMNLKDKASIVNWHDYKNWRDRGVAFVVRDECAYEISNKTLASGRILTKGGERIPRRGYWGDIINSPYVTFGVESHDASQFEQKNNVHVNTATSVAMFNVNNTMRKFAEQTKTGQGNVQIHFLPIGSISTLHKKSKYINKFNLIYFSNSMVHLLNSDVEKLFKCESYLIVESTKFMLDLKSELHHEFTKKIRTMSGAVNCEEITSFKAERDSYGLFSHKKCLL